MPSLPDLRRFLADHYNDEELTGLCFDHFPEVFRNFAADMTTTRKGIALLDYCQRRDRLPELVALLERERPESFPTARMFHCPPGPRWMSTPSPRPSTR